MTNPKAQIDPTARAQMGLALLKEAVCEALTARPEGMGNAEVARALGIRSKYGKKTEDYLSWSVLGMLLNEGVVRRLGRKYVLESDSKRPQHTGRRPAAGR
jgi:hypothetical protein